MNWFVLAIAGLLEIVWAIGLRHTQGFTKFWPSIITLTSMLGSLYLLSLAMKSLPASTAYAVWVGIGVIGTTIFGFVVFEEAVSPLRMGSVILIMCGIAGLKLASGH